MSFGRQLVIGVATLILITMVTGVVAIFGLRDMASVQDEVARNFTTDIVQVERLRAVVDDVFADTRAGLVRRVADPSAGLDVSTTALERQVRAMAREAPDNESQAELRQIEQLAKDYIATARLLSSQNVLPPVFLATLGTQREDIAHHIAGYLHHQQRRFETDLSAAHTSSDRAEWLVIGTTALALLLSGVLAATVIRKLGRMFQREKSALEVAQHEATGRQEILAVVSHDLRNPLGTIVMGSSVLRELLPPGTPPACVRQLQAISNAADRMTNMINQVLDEARIEIGTIRLHLGRCELNELVRTAMQLFQTRAEQCSIQVVFEPPVAQLEIRADRERVLQILSNLLGNALKYTPQGGRIEVRVVPSDDEIEVSVTDSGPGISRDQLPHIFERYYQGPSKERGSLGLGLYICKNLVEAHGGRIWADPAVEHGARITFTLPRGGPVAGIAGPRGGSRASVAEPPHG